MGYGFLNVEQAQELMFAPLAILDFDGCLSKLEDYSYYYNTEKFKKLYNQSYSWDLCTFKDIKSICPGDFGGPFICNENGKAVVQGIAPSTSIMKGIYTT